jgi:hypothetical protein
MAGIAFGAVNRLVQQKLTSRISAESFQKPAQTGLGGFAGDEGSCGNGTRIDHWVAGPASLRLQTDGIEGVAGGFHPDFAKHLLAAIILQSKAINKRLGDGLNGERLLGIARFIHGAVGGCEADPKPVWVGFSEVRDVSGDFAFVQRREFPMQILDIILNGR